MTQFENSICRSISHNATIFMRFAIKMLVDEKCKWRETLSTDDFILAVSHIQIAMELAMKVYLIRLMGIMYVLESPQKLNISKEADIIRLYNERRLRVQDFDSLKKSLKKQVNGSNLSSFKKEDIKEIENFQTLRNKLLHFTCILDDSELKDSSERILAYSIHTVMYLLYDKFQKGTPDEFFTDTLGWDFYEKLKNCKKYGRLVEIMLEERGETAWECPMCLHRTFSADQHFCYCCNYELHDMNLTYCLNCDEPRSVIYHKSPYVNQPNVYSGWCLNCGCHPAVYECPECHCCHEFYADNGKKYCSDGNCINKNGIKDQMEYLHDKAEEVI